MEPMGISEVTFNIEKETAWPKYQNAMAKCGLSEDDLQFIWKAITEHKSGRLDVQTRASRFRVAEFPFGL